MLRRHLLFFLTGALLALAAVLVVRAGDGGAPAPSAAITTTTATSATPVVHPARRHRPRHPRGRHPKGATSQPSRAPATTPVAPVRRPAGGAPTTTQPPTATQPSRGSVPLEGSGGPDTEPQPESGADTGASPPPDDGAAVTIPNPATPDASVGP